MAHDRHGRAFQFKVIVGPPAADRDAGHTGIGAAGYLQVRDGSAVVDEIPLSAAMEGGLLRERVKMRRLVAAQDSRNLYPSMVHSFIRVGNSTWNGRNPSDRLRGRPSVVAHGCRKSVERLRPIKASTLQLRRLDCRSCTEQLILTWG